MNFRPTQHPAAQPYTIGIKDNRLTVQPERADGDAFYGLEIGTNGTAAAARRAAVEAEIQSTQNYAWGPPVWLRANGKPAAGLQLVPTDRSDTYEANPWSGRA
jgi:hypothetical protein